MLNLSYYPWLTPLIKMSHWELEDKGLVID